MIKQLIFWTLLACYLYFAYHLLVIPAFLDFSIYGVIATVIVVAIMLWMTPASKRKQIIIFSSGFLLLDKALFNSLELGAWLQILAFIFIFFVISIISKLYGKLPVISIFVMITLNLIFTFSLQRDEVQILTHLTKKWSSERLYTGEVFDYFPLELKDINGDGIDEIVTFGNVKETDEQEAKEDRYPYIRKTESIFPYVFQWNGSTMERIATENMDQRSFIKLLREDYPGFPYYTFNQENQLEPLIQKQPLVESAMQIGMTPFLAFSLDMKSLDQIMEHSNGIMDQQQTFEGNTAFSQVEIKQGEITGFYQNKPFRVKTDATTIIGPIYLANDQQGLVLFGKDLVVYSYRHDTLQETHRLTSKQLKNLRTSEFMIEDVNGDQIDEILLSSEHSSIIKPQNNGKWEILWTSTNPSFRFEDFGTVGSGKKGELITLDNSTVRNHPLRYLTSYTYTDEGLKRNWKVMLSLINVRTGDIDGDNENEIVASIYRSHQVFVFEKHSVPVTLLLLIITGLLIVYGFIRRVRYGND